MECSFIMHVCIIGRVCLDDTAVDVCCFIML